MNGCCSRQSDDGTGVAGFLLGVAIGAIVALLYAPKPGAVLRTELQTELDDRLDEVKERLDQVRADLAQAVSAARDGARDGAARARQQVGLEDE